MGMDLGGDEAEKALKVLLVITHTAAAIVGGLVTWAIIIFI